VLTGSKLCFTINRLSYHTTGWLLLDSYTGLLKMFVGVLTTCHTQYTWNRSMCIFYLIEQHSKILLHTLQLLYMWTLCDSTNVKTIIVFIACQRWRFQWRFWYVPSVSGYTRTLSLETVHTTFECNCQMVVVSRILVRNYRWTIVPRQSFWITLYNRHIFSAYSLRPPLSEFFHDD